MLVVELDGVPVRENEAVPDPELVLVAADVAEVDGALVDVAVEVGEDVEESVAEGEEELVPD